MMPIAVTESEARKRAKRVLHLTRESLGWTWQMLARFLGLTQETTRRFGAPNYPQTIQLWRLMQLPPEGRVAAARAIAEGAGAIVVEVPTVSPAVDVGLVARAHKETADVVGELLRDFADRRFTRSEAIRAQRELLEAIEVLAQGLALCEVTIREGVVGLADDPEELQA